MALVRWRAFRDLAYTRYLALALPRVLLRLPYEAKSQHADGFNYHEDMVKNSGDTASDPASFLWGNPAFLLAERITNAFALYHWPVAIRGIEGGGLVENLPMVFYPDNNGNPELLCPLEVSTADSREKELRDLGFISLCHCKGTGKAAFFSAQTAKLSEIMLTADASADAKMSTMLPYLLAALRFEHTIQVIMRGKVGSFLTRATIESLLSNWISDYVLLDGNAGEEIQSSYPLRSGKVVVTEVSGEPGVYQTTVYVKPRFQLAFCTYSEVKHKAEDSGLLAPK